MMPPELCLMAMPRAASLDVLPPAVSLVEEFRPWPMAAS